MGCSIFRPTKFRGKPASLDEIHGIDVVAKKIGAAIFHHKGKRFTATALGKSGIKLYDDVRNTIGALGIPAVLIGAAHTAEFAPHDLEKINKFSLALDGLHVGVRALVNLGKILLRIEAAELSHFIDGDFFCIEQVGTSRQETKQANQDESSSTFHDVRTNCQYRA